MAGLGVGRAAGISQVAQRKPIKENAIASATFDATPRVGIVLSSFGGSSDHDGTPIRGLPDPRPVDADLDATHIDAMVRKAIELGAQRRGGLKAIVGPEDWLVIKPDISTCPGLTPAWSPGTATDLRIIHSLVSFLIENKCGKRITIAEGAAGWMPVERSGKPVDGWRTDWEGAFGGLSYKKMIADFSRRWQDIRFELLDLNFADYLEVPVPRKAHAAGASPPTYFVPKVILQCDRLISVAPLKTDAETGVSLSIRNYFGIAPGARYGFPKRGLDKMGDPNEVMVDLFCFHPADYALVGGSWGFEGNVSGVPPGAAVHHNVIVAGAKAVAVDAIGAAIMGFAPAELPYLQRMERRGFGVSDIDAIWTRGNDLDEAKRNFRKPEGWHANRNEE
jgi:hypothetical protein